MIATYQIQTTPNFERDFRKLDRATARRVSKKLKWLAAHPEMLSRPLQNLPSDLVGLQRYRVGDYRLLLWVDHSRRRLTLYAVAHRSAIYREL